MQDRKIQDWKMQKQYDVIKCAIEKCKTLKCNTMEMIIRYGVTRKLFRLYRECAALKIKPMSSKAIRQSS